MKKIAKNLVLKILTNIKFRVNRFLHEKILFRLASKANVFTSIFRNNYWGSEESLSGPGSTIKYTQNIRLKIPTMFDEMGIKSVFDAPCGDMHWMHHLLNGANFRYLGGDIVDELVVINKKKFANDKVNFISFDITTDVFPLADVWLCRAVFYHLSNRDIYLALEKFVNSKIKFILTTNHITSENHVNKDIKTGDWRLLNLTLPPFNFSFEPLWEVDDYIDPHPPATLTLWTREQVELILPALRNVYRK